MGKVFQVWRNLLRRSGSPGTRPSNGLVDPFVRSVSGSGFSSVRISLSLTNQRRFMRLIHDQFMIDNIPLSRIILLYYNSLVASVPMAAGTHRNTF